MKEKQNFYDWCIQNNRIDFLDRWDYKLNEISPKEVNCCVHIEYYFKCPREIHESELIQISSITNMEIKSKCRKCNSFAQWGIDNICPDFLEKYWDYEKNTEDPFIIPHSSHKFKVFIKCETDTYLYVFPNDFTRKGNINNVLNSLKNGKCREISKNNNVKKKIRKKRKISKLESKVLEYLIDKYNYTINHETYCDIVAINPKTKRKLPFDNEIKELKLIIEVNGEQHYYINTLIIKMAENHNTTPEQELHKRRLYDRYKKYIAYINGYHYLEIPYWTLKEESYKRLIDLKIKNILKKKKNT